MSKPPYEAILVLGGGVNPDGSLTESLQERVKEAAVFYKNHQAPRIIMSGGNSYKLDVVPKKTEAAAMRDYTLTQDIPAEDICIEDKSKNTVGNAYYAKTCYLMPAGWHRILIIISPNHLKDRVRYIFKKVCGPEYTVMLAPIAENPAKKVQEREHKALHVLKSWLDAIPDGDHEAVLSIMKQKHPAFSASSKYSVEDMKQLFGDV